MFEIVVTAYYEANREPTQEELDALKYAVEDGIVDSYATSAGLQFNYLWASSALAQVLSPAYLERYPLDTPGRVYETIAGRIRAGEPEADVLADMGLCSAKVLEAARAFAAVTAGLENTPEGAALLAALEATND